MSCNSSVRIAVLCIEFPIHFWAFELCGSCGNMHACKHLSQAFIPSCLTALLHLRLPMGVMEGTRMVQRARRDYKMGNTIRQMACCTISSVCVCLCSCCAQLWPASIVTAWTHSIASIAQPCTRFAAWACSFECLNNLAHAP